MRLGILICVLCATACSAAERSERVSREIGSVLARPEYNRVFKEPAVSKFWESIKRWFEKAFAWFMGLLSNNGAKSGRVFSIVFACLVILAFLVLLAFVVRRLVRSARSRPGADDPEQENYVIPSPKPLIRQAEKLAAAGDYRGAFRCAYLASIAYLDDKGVLRYERSRTNWEYLRQLAEGGHDSIRADLRPLTLDFDRKFYGRELCAEDDYLRAVATFKKLSAEART
jgi:hypothetical protein